MAFDSEEILTESKLPEDEVAEKDKSEEESHISEGYEDIKSVSLPSEYPSKNDFPEKAISLVEKAENFIADVVEVSDNYAKNLEISLKELSRVERIRPLTTEEVKRDPFYEKLFTDIKSTHEKSVKDKRSSRQKNILSFLGNKKKKEENINDGLFGSGFVETPYKKLVNHVDNIRCTENPVDRSSDNAVERFFNHTVAYAHYSNSLKLVDKCKPYLSSEEYDGMVARVQNKLDRVHKSYQEEKSMCLGRVIKNYEAQTYRLQEDVIDAINGENKDLQGFSLSSLLTKESHKMLTSITGGTVSEKILSDLYPKASINYPNKLKKTLNYIENRDSELGKSDDLFFHNNRDPQVLKSILSGGLVSRKEGLRAGMKIPFTRGGEGVTMSREGVEIEDRFLTWEEFSHISSPRRELNMPKNPMQELDQLLVSKNSVYENQSDWVIAFPSRKLITTHEYTEDSDGVHLLPQEYDSSSREKEFETVTPDLDKVGAKIDLNSEDHFMLIFKSSSIESWKSYLENTFEKLPNADRFDSFDDWYKEYVLEVDDFGGESVETVRKEMFTRFTIPKTSGRVIATGNFVDTAAQVIPVYKYYQSEK